MRIAPLFILMLCFLIGFKTFAANYETSPESCYGFPKIKNLKTKPASCIGLVASEAEVSWSWPRKVIILENTAYITALGSWEKNTGQLWKIDLHNGTAKLLFDKTDRTHGLGVGPDGFIYYGDATAIYKFNPQNPIDREVVISNLPDNYRQRDNKVIDSNHPLTDFTFLENGDLVVNIGAPSNDCKKEYASQKACYQRDEQAELRLYPYNSRTNSYDSDFLKLAKGLRNSMGLVHNPILNEIYQVENASDAKGTPDEMNLISLDNFDPNNPLDFGWPFCYGFGNRYTGYEVFKTFCGKQATQPWLLLPPHSAPLDMIYYYGDMFPELNNYLLVSWHGHSENGSRIAAYPTDKNARPLTPSKSQNPLNTPEILIDNWQKRPKGRPVGLAVDSQGAIFIVDDKNNSLIVLATGEGNVKIDSNIGYSTEDLRADFSRESLEEWNQLFQPAFLRTNCNECHSDVVNQNSSLQSLANFIDRGWLKKGEKNLKKQVLWFRINGLGGKIMPPSNTYPSLLDHEAKGDNTLSVLRKWLEKNL